MSHEYVSAQTLPFRAAPAKAQMVAGRRIAGQNARFNPGGN